MFHPSKRGRPRWFRMTRWRSWVVGRMPCAGAGADVMWGPGFHLQQDHQPWFSLLAAERTRRSLPQTVHGNGAGVGETTLAVVPNDCEAKDLEPFHLSIHLPWPSPKSCWGVARPHLSAWSTGGAGYARAKQLCTEELVQAKDAAEAFLRASELED
ncbi:unnamed protein product [Durusdinium trenchii]|uniref:Uncharacterized protein n=1 Tax=Durusdinium trenchii TaxID=1381693 RepID=A0ABP0HZR4_9DINO